MRKLVITVGCSGSGKSTYAKESVNNGWVEINRDNYRFSLFCNGVHDWSLYKFSKHKEDEVSKRCLVDFTTAVYSDKNIIVSNTNLRQKDIDYWSQLGKTAGYEVEVEYFDVLLEELLKRDTKRGALSVGREVLLEQWKKWLIVSGFRTYQITGDKPKAIWLDIDGTIALNTHRGHHDYEKVITDTPRLDVISMVQSWMDRDNLQPVFMSGRPESCRADTVKWLLEYFDEVPYLYMRQDGDKRSDRLVKQELFWEHLAPYWDVVAAVDDRPRITRLQKDLGVPLVISVQIGYNEF